MGWRLGFGVSGGSGIRFPGAADSRGTGSSSVGCEQAERSSLQPWHLLGPHQHGFVEGFLTAESPFVLVCVLETSWKILWATPIPPFNDFFFS